MGVRNLFFWIIIFCLFFFKSIFSLDPDFGWHLQVGRHILSHGIPYKDMYSYTMPSYPFLDHEWLTDIGIAWVHDHLGLIILSFIFSLISLGAMYISLKWVGAGESFHMFPLVALGAVVLSEYSGIRPQVITWLFLSILLSILFSSSSFLLYMCIPFLFILWVNLHGGFSIGLILLFVILLIRGVQSHSRDQWIKYIFLACTSFFSTWINPYGKHVWVLVLQHLMDGRQRWTIAEWQLLFVQVDPSLLILISLFIVVEVLYWRKFSWDMQAVLILLLSLSISALRHIPLWILVGLPFIIKGISTFSHILGSNPDIMRRKKQVFFRFSIFMCVLAAGQGIYLLGRMISFSEPSFYPKYAITYLHTFQRQGKLFSPYSWGGYLIWKLPEKKLFVDGRMPTWRNPNAPKGETKDAFGEYLDIVNRHVSTIPSMSKWGIDTVLWYPCVEKENSQHISFLSFFPPPLWQYLYKEKDKEKDFIQDLRDASWRVVYQDATSCVLRRPS